jgi:hypothetical protein
MVRFSRELLNMELPLVKLHSKRVGKMLKYTRNEWGRCEHLQALAMDPFHGLDVFNRSTVLACIFRIAALNFIQLTREKHTRNECILLRKNIILVGAYSNSMLGSEHGLTLAALFDLALRQMETTLETSEEDVRRILQEESGNVI